MMEGPQCRFRREARARERHQHPVVDGLKVLDPKRPIREADMERASRHVADGPLQTHAPQQRHRYSITSSARERSDGGTVRPSALAVLRLMTNSYLVGSWIGRSAGFSPRRTRST